MESKIDRINADPTAHEARAALGDADAARKSVAQGVYYPPLYLPLMAFSGASYPLLMAVGSDGVPSNLANALLLIIGVIGVSASAGALAIFESANKVRITGLRTGKRLGFAFMIATLVLLASIAGIAHNTEAWWVALIGAPIGAAFTVAYAKAWLTDYHRQNA